MRIQADKTPWKIFIRETTMESRRNIKQDSEASGGQSSTSKGKKSLLVEGYPVEGLPSGGRKICVIFPSIKSVFDIGRCPKRAISQDFLFVNHGRTDQIGGLLMHVAARELYNMKPPTIFVPMSIKERVETMFEIHRAMGQRELKHNLVGLNVGEEFQLRNDLKVKAFKTYHVITSQGYIIYSVKKKLKSEFHCLSGNEIKNLKLSGAEITDTITNPEIAFTGDTTSDFIVDPNNSDVLKARVLVMESTFIDDAMSVQKARDGGHMHLFEIAKYGDLFKNKAIVLIHFSARYHPEKIEAAIAKLPPSFAGRVFALTNGF